MKGLIIALTAVSLATACGPLTSTEDDGYEVEYDVAPIVRENPAEVAERLLPMFSTAMLQQVCAEARVNGWEQFRQDFLEGWQMTNDDYQHGVDVSHEVVRLMKDWC